jgi:hypothetical protein
VNFELAERLLRRVTPGANGCWIWTGYTDGNGRWQYGRLRTGRRTRTFAHRVSYETFVAPIPEGMFIDHLCRTTRCVNPDHLEPVTARENLARSPVLKGAPAMRGICRNGHEQTPENTYYTPRSGSRCKPCTKATNAAWRRRQKESASCV